MNMTYNFSATQNNGRITSSVDPVTGETVTYQYDALKRLQKAYTTSGSWSDTYTYDGFGNLTNMAPAGTSGAPPLNIQVNPLHPTSNQTMPSGASYDANGNMSASPGMLLGYDVANRAVSVGGSTGDAYWYDSENRQIYYRIGVAGRDDLSVRRGRREAGGVYPDRRVEQWIQLTEQSYNIYFAGRLITAKGNPVGVDRLGSVRWTYANYATAFHTYFPYGALIANGSRVRQDPAPRAQRAHTQQPS